MSEHAHREYVEGCFRCDLSRDEVPPQSMRAEVDHEAGATYGPAKASDG